MNRGGGKMAEPSTGAPPSQPLTEAPATDGAAPAESSPSNGQTPPSGPAERRRLGGVGRRRIRLIVFPLIAVVLLVALGIGVKTYLDNLWYVSTDNAQVTGQPVPVGSLNAGRIEAIDVQTGSMVQKGQVLARVLLGTDVSSAPVRESITAPFDGTVIAVPVGAGATVTPGQAIVEMVNPSTVYVNANIDETSVRRVAPGQPVDVHLDALNQTVDGQVEQITPASAATFSLLPQSNGSGSFTKVTQLVPVKIGIDVGADEAPLVGTSAEVTIHVAGH
jgi:multidrug resistance efflux pump